MNNLGFTDATDIGMTCATVGILAGIFGGLFFIKIGTKRGWTKYIQSFQYISGDLKTGLVKDESVGPSWAGRPFLPWCSTPWPGIWPCCW